MSQVRQRSLAEALRAARTNAGSTPAPSTDGSGGGSRTPHSSSSSPARRRIVSTASIRSKPSSARLSPTAFDYFNDPAVLVSTPVEEGRESEFAEHLSYAFNYSADLVTILKSGSYKEKTGVSIDGDDSDTEFAVLLAALGHVLFPIAYTEVSKLLDLEHDFDFYHVTLNELIFTILPVVLRGTALALYHEAARCHPTDGRFALQRLRYAVEGVPDPDVDRFWVKLRATVIDETLDPTPQLAIIRSLGDKHARLHPDYGENKRVADLWHVLAASAKSTPYVTPLYLAVIRDLRGGTHFSFSSLCLRVRTTWREESAYATLSHTPQPPGGGYRPKAANDRPPQRTLSAPVHLAPSSPSVNGRPNHPALW
ncbi:hypothetical protein CYMTET_40064 [Cymbomonas tetramitiformis]|uniref:Uncharacterized protein n=1 Tax=Cymbomonas tetramitiformis TaxID=36881 RepID=A0AAE0F4Z4_9CHLO|nr:hypothetical protein CYMTET_40064 [Cymbomonas tetramitiformis]